jgi:ketosteroid isomerase-like protein
MQKPAPPMDSASAHAFAKEWISAWNGHDAEHILSYYSPDVTIRSPKVVKLAGVQNGMLQGKAAVGEYFARGLKAFPDLHFELLDVLWGMDTIVLYYTNQVGGRTAEVMQLDAAGKICRVWANYDGKG